MIAAQVIFDLTAVALTDIATGRNGFGGPSTSEKGLTNAFARHGISGGGRITNEENGLLVQRHIADPRRNGPRFSLFGGVRHRSEKVSDMRSS